MRPLAIDLFCGLGGWTEGLLAEGWDVIGFDIEQHVYGEHRYPAQLVLQDVLTLHGAQFWGADLIVASPPCQEFSYMAMPWTRGKQIAGALRGKSEFPSGYTGSRTVDDLTALFRACFRIQREACEESGRVIPLIVENVRGAEIWVGRARWHFGSFYLWGNVPGLMPTPARITKTVGHANKRDGHSHTRHLTNQSESDALKGGGDWFGAGADCSQQRRAGSRSAARKAASARIAKIPFALSRHIAATYYPRREAVA